MRLTGPICTTAGNEAALPLALEMTIGGQRFRADANTALKVDEKGLIREFRANWNPGQMTPVGQARGRSS